ncbi:tachylectin-related carbohydrate-binding protein [Lentzea sp. NPDC003310]|uniref:tachylectin-related carbohydrate-binding protein n=1 Tax=Lentzea sp. NPDC003310 TaxID=3154447 RepID=UPI0033A9461B
MRARGIALAVFTAAGLATPVLATTATAAGTLSCQTAAPVFVRHPDTGLELRAHQEPENGNPVWNANRGIGFSWDGQMRTGPGGRVYEFTPEGVINKFRWDGNGWDRNGASDPIATGWHGWGDAASKTRLAIDSRGDFYGMPSDNALHWWRFDESTGTWSERIIDTGWGTKYDMIFADGPGGLFARSTDGKLFRYQYDADSQRWLEYARQVGDSGWGQFSDVASVGGGVFYALKADTGQLRWYRYAGNGSWAPDSGKFISDGWSSAWQIEGAPDACQVLGGDITPPATPTLTPNYTAPLGAYQGDDNLVNYFAVNGKGQLLHGRQRHSNDILLVDHAVLPGHEQFTGAVGFGLYPDGKIEVQANSSADAVIRSRSQISKNRAEWSPTFTERAGKFVSSPALVRDKDNLLVSFGVDASGGLWYSKQLVLWGAPEQGRFGAWRSLGGSGLTADFSALRNGDAIEIVGRYTDGSVRASKFDGTTLTGTRGTGVTDVLGKPAAVVQPGGKVQIVVRRADNRIYTQLEGTSGFPGTWQPIGSLVAAGAPAAVIAGTGRLEVSVRDANGLVNTSGQSAPALPFSAWEIRDFHEAGTDTTMFKTNNGDVLLTWRDPAGEVYTYLGSFGTSPTARTAVTSVSYAGGKTRR